MSIKGIVLAVVSALAGATLIAFGGCRFFENRQFVLNQSKGFVSPKETEKIISEGEKELEKIEKYFNSALTYQEYGYKEKVHEDICNIFYREFDPQNPYVIFEAVNFGMPRTAEYDELKKRQDNLRIRFERFWEEWQKFHKECKQPMMFLLWIMVAVCDMNMQKYFANIPKDQLV